MQKLFNGSILMDSHFCLMSRMGLILMKHNPWCIKSNFFSQILFDTIEGSIIIQHSAQYQYEIPTTNSITNLKNIFGVKSFLQITNFSICTIIQDKTQSYIREKIWIKSGRVWMYS